MSTILYWSQPSPRGKLGRATNLLEAIQKEQHKENKLAAIKARRKASRKAIIKAHQEAARNVEKTLAVSA